MKTKIKKVVSILLIFATLFAFAGCSTKCWGGINGEKFEEGFFKCKVWGENEKRYVSITGLTDLGNEQEVIIIPDKIHGINVGEIRDLTNRVGGQWRSTKLKKLYVPRSFDIESGSFSECVNLEKKILLDPPQGSGGGGANYITYLKHIGPEPSPGSYYLDANISFKYNYEESPNDGFYWIDDIDYGTKIEIIPNNPTREGYIFGGWFKEAECKTVWDFDLDTSPKERIDEETGEVIYQETALYAKWFADKKEY